jgi:hypothetical protein
MVEQAPREIIMKIEYIILERMLSLPGKSPLDKRPLAPVSRDKQLR